MKKNILKVAFAAAFVAVAGYGIYTNQKGAELSDLALSNVEALANDDEWGTGFNCRWIDELYLHCWPWGTGLGCPCYM